MNNSLFLEITSIYQSAVHGAEQVLTEYQRAQARSVIASAVAYLAPPPPMSTHAWAEKNVTLPSEVTGQPGPWRTERRPWARGFMDAFDDPNIVQVTIKKASRMAVTSCINNHIGRHIHYDPCAIMYVQQTLGEAKKYSHKLLDPFIIGTPVVAELLPVSKSRSKGNTILEKKFPGGSLTLVGANVPTGFRMVFAKILYLDDVDGFEWSVGKEGDPVKNAMGRVADVWDKKIIMASKPTVKGYSRIDLAYEQSDKRQYYVPCPLCGTHQTLKWGGKDSDFGIKWTSGDPSSAYYLCSSCHGVIRDFHKAAMCQAGEWRATAVAPGHAGFGELSQLYHPQVPWSDIVADFLSSKAVPEQLQVFVNDRLGECWEDKGEGLDENSLMARRESYASTGPLPEGVALLTAAVDVQDDWLEVGVEGWGRGEENWVVDHQKLSGDTLLPDVWEALDKYLLTTWQHPAGVTLRIAAVAIDSGFRDEVVSSFVRGRLKSGRNILAIKGDDKTRTGKIIGDIPDKKNRYKVKIYMVNSTRAKSSVFGRLKIQKPGPAYCHFSIERDEAYFAGLLSERWVTVRKDGVLKRMLIKKPGARNEPLDIKGYNLATLEWLKQHRRFDLDKLADDMVARMKAKAEAEAAGKQAAPQEEAKKKIGRRIISRGVYE